MEAQGDVRQIISHLDRTHWFERFICLMLAFVVCICVSVFDIVLSFLLFFLFSFWVVVLLCLFLCVHFLSFLMCLSLCCLA